MICSRKDVGGKIGRLITEQSQGLFQILVVGSPNELAEPERQGVEPADALRRTIGDDAAMIRVALLIALFASPALAQEPPGVFSDYARQAPELRVVDGDTVVIAGERIRLRSEAGPIDAPELGKAKCPLELFRAEAAKDRLAALLTGREPEIVRHGADRYGRTVAVLLVDGKDIGAELVREGHAKRWPKLTKADRPTWCGESQ